MTAMSAERAIEWGAAFAAAVLAAVFHSPRWWWAAAAAALAALSSRVLYKRWPWRERPVVLVGRDAYPLAEAIGFLKPSEFFSLAFSRGRAALRGPRGLLPALASYAGSPQESPAGRRSMAKTLQMTRAFCGECLKPMPDVFFDAALSQALHGTPPPAGADRCASCGGMEFLFLCPPPAA